MTEERNFQKLNIEYKGRRIRLLNMKDDPNPISSGSEGTIIHVDDAGTVHVKWDNGRTLGVIIGHDKFQIF